MKGEAGVLSDWWLGAKNLIANYCERVGYWEEVELFGTSVTAGKYSPSLAGNESGLSIVTRDLMQCTCSMIESMIEPRSRHASRVMYAFGLSHLQRIRCKTPTSPVSAIANYTLVQDVGEGGLAILALANDLMCDPVIQ